jgi:transposase
MPQPYSVDLRERVVAAAASQTQADVAVRFAVSESTVYKWCRRAREAGTVAPKPHAGGGHAKVDAAGGEVLRALVRERNERTLEELATLYTARTGVRVSLSAVSRACRRLDLRRKKKEPLPRRADA